MAQGEPKHSRNLLVPVDDAEDCRHALQWALDNVHRPGDVVHLLHIIAMDVSSHISAFGHSTEQQEEHREELKVDHARTVLEQRFTSTLEAAKVDYHVSILKGRDDTDSIGEAICQKADELNAVLVAMAAHTHGPLVRFFVGSTSRYCVRHSRSTVMVWHADRRRSSVDV